MCAEMSDYPCDIVQTAVAVTTAVPIAAAVVKN